jgi:glycosyltransferase involved in cell wall biosynthesis
MKNKVKLLFCINSLSSKGGGAEKVLSTILNYLVNKNYDIKLITFDNKQEKFFYNFNKKIETYLLGETILFKNKFLLNLNKIFILIFYLLKIKPNITFGFMHSIYINLTFASFFSKSKIVACDHILPDHFYNKKFEFFLLKLSFFFADRVTVVSNQVKNKFQKLLKKKINIIDNIVNNSDYKKKIKRNRQKIILSIGRLVKQKNFFTLVNAFNIFLQKNKGWRLVIIGDGEDKKNLIAQINYFKINKYVTIINYTKKVENYYRKASIYVSTSIYESFGLTVAEALVQRLPCVAFKKCPGVNQIIKHNKNGILVKGSFDDYNKLAAKLDKLVNNKRKLKAMQNFYDHKFLFRNDKNYVFKKWEKLINNLL